MNYQVLIGRILFSLIFIMAGLANHLGNLGEMSGWVASKGVPVANIVVVVTGLMIIAGGLSVMLGYKTKIGAWILIAFLIPTALIMHNFWALEGAEASNQMAHFLKNLSMAGGALLIAHYGPGPMSLDAKAQKSGAESGSVSADV